MNSVYHSAYAEACRISVVDSCEDYHRYGSDKAHSVGMHRKEAEGTTDRNSRNSCLSGLYT